MIRLVIVAITVIGFLILSIPILFVEWIIGKFSPRTKEISSLRIIQAVFKFILWEAGTKVTIIGEENVPKDTQSFILVITEATLTLYFPTVAARSVPVILQRKKWNDIRFFPTGCAICIACFWIVRISNRD